MSNWVLTAIGTIQRAESRATSTSDGPNHAREHGLAVRAFCCGHRVSDGVTNAPQDLASVSEVLSECGKVRARDLVAEVAYGAIENGVEEFHLFVI